MKPETPESKWTLATLREYFEAKLFAVEQNIKCEHSARDADLKACVLDATCHAVLVSQSVKLKANVP